jgi:cytochrome c-type biogenesis protein CcmH/NrfG
MDTLSDKGRGMKKISIAVAAGIIVIVMAAFVFMINSPGKRAEPQSSSDKVVPSKENVSQGVKERIEHLRQVIEKNPEDARTMFALAQLLQDAHNLQDAVKYYAQALLLNPTNTSARIDYALCLHEIGKDDDAFVQTRWVLRDDAANAQALYNMGALHANGSGRDSAVAYWSKLIKLHPHDELATKARENLKALTGTSSAL